MPDLSSDTGTTRCCSRGAGHSWPRQDTTSRHSDVPHLCSDIAVYGCRSVLYDLGCQKLNSLFFQYAIGGLFLILPAPTLVRVPPPPMRTSLDQLPGINESRIVIKYLPS